MDLIIDNNTTCLRIEDVQQVYDKRYSGIGYYIKLDNVQYVTVSN